MTTQVASPVSAHGLFHKPLQVAILGAVAALAFTGGILAREAHEESTASNPAAVQQHSTAGESPRAAATRPLTLYLVGSDEAAGRLRSELEVTADTDGQAAATNAQVLVVGAAGGTTLKDARLQVVDLRSAGTAQRAASGGTATVAGALDQPQFMP